MGFLKFIPNKALVAIITAIAMLFGEYAAPIKSALCMLTGADCG
jgi:hypothetical protein